MLLFKVKMLYCYTQVSPGCLILVARMSPALLLLCGSPTATGCTAAAADFQLKRTGEIHCIGLFA